MAQVMWDKFHCDIGKDVNCYSLVFKIISCSWLRRHFLCLQLLTVLGVQILCLLLRNRVLAWMNWCISLVFFCSRARWTNSHAFQVITTKLFLSY